MRRLGSGPTERASRHPQRARWHRLDGVPRTGALGSSVIPAPLGLAWSLFEQAACGI